MALSRIPVVCVTVLLLHPPVAAEELFSTLAQPQIAITLNFHGETVVVLNAIDTANAPPRTYDLVAAVTGPREKVTAWHKERMVGIWINAESRTYDAIPPYLGVFPNRPFDAIAPEETRRRQQIGFTYALAKPAAVA